MKQIYRLLGAALSLQQARWREPLALAPPKVQLRLQGGEPDRDETTPSDLENQLISTDVGYCQKSRVR